jgi:hypothetical protein
MIYNFYGGSITLGLVEVAVVGAHQGSRNMLERRVGGILKNLSNVRAFSELEVPQHKIDMIVVHLYGGKVMELERKFKNVKVLGIELVLLPIGVKALLSALKEGEKVGVIAEHLRCANYLMSEIIKSGIANVHFVSGTFDEMESMKVDRFIVAEEMVERIPDNILKLKANQLLMVPRMVSPQSSAQMIHYTLDIANGIDT